jgi:lysophospholipase L1-like esterase
LVEVQQALAEKMNLGFWNLYETMGGEGSMVKWVEGDTVFANKDYTHLNFKGAKKVAYLLYDYLMKEFENYKELKKNPHGFTAKAPIH